MARITKAKNNRMKSEKKKKEEKLLPNVIDITVILPDQKQIILKGISTDRIIDVKKLLTVHIDSCHYTNYSLSHETKGDRLNESFEIVHLKPCVLTLIEENYTEETAIVNVRRIIDLFSCINSFGISTKERENKQIKNEEKLPKKKEKKERKEIDTEKSREIQTNSNSSSSSSSPSPPSNPTEKSNSSQKDASAHELKVDPLGIMHSKKTTNKSNKPTDKSSQIKSDRDFSSTADAHEESNFASKEDIDSKEDLNKEREDGNQVRGDEKDVGFQKSGKSEKKVAKFEEKEEAVEAMAKARAMAEKGDMTGMYPNQSKIGEFYDFFSLSHLHSPIQHIERSTAEISLERRKNGKLFEIEVCFTSGNPKAVSIVSCIEGFYEKEKNYLEKNITSLLKKISKTFSQAYGELMSAFVDRNKFGNFPYGLRSNTFLIPPSSSKDVFSFSQLPVEDEKWNGNGGGVDMNNFKNFQAFSVASQEKQTENSLNINWHKYFQLLSKMACKSPEERLIRDRKVFLFHSFFVEFAAKKTVEVIEKMDSNRSAELYSPDKASGVVTRGSERIAELETENLKIHVWRSATDASFVNCLKMEVDSEVFSLSDDSDMMEAFEENLREKNLLKGISADESATVHDLDSLSCLLVQHRGYLAHVKVSNPSNYKNVPADEISEENDQQLEKDFEIFNHEIKIFEKLFEADGGSNSLNPSNLRSLLHKKMNSGGQKKQLTKDSTDSENLNFAESIFRNILLKSVQNLKFQTSKKNNFIRWELGACWQQSLQNTITENNKKEEEKDKKENEDIKNEKKKGDGLSADVTAEGKEEEGSKGVGGDSESVKEEREMNENDVFFPLKEKLGLKKFERLVESKTNLHSKTIEELIEGANDYYDNTALPKLVSDFASLELSPVDGKTLTDFMHTRGLKIRSLGKVAKEAENLPHIKSLCIHEMVSRAFKKIIMSSLSFSPNHLFDASILATCFNFILGKNCIPPFHQSQSSNSSQLQDEQRKAEENDAVKDDSSLASTTCDDDSADDISELIWQWVKLFIEKRYEYDISNESESIRKLSILRSLCLKIGIEIVSKDYDFETSRPFKPTDIISMIPIFKHVSCSSADGRTLLEASKNFLDKGKLEDAVNYGTKALTKLISVCGPYNRMTAGAYSLLAVVLYHTGDFNQATIYQQKALDINERELGLDNPDTMKSYGDLAVFYYRLQHTELALKYVKRALYLLHLTCGTNHPNTAATYINIAMMEEGLGNVHLALRYLHEALKCNKRLLGPDHIQTAASYHAIAIALSLMEAYSLSVQHEKTTLQILQEKLGSDDLRTQDAAAWLDYFESKAIEQQECIKNGFPKIDSSIASKGHLSVSDLLEFINDQEMDGSISNKKSKKGKKVNSNLDSSKKKNQSISNKIKIGNKNEDVVIHLKNERVNQIYEENDDKKDGNDNQKEEEPSSVSSSTLENELNNSSINNTVDISLNQITTIDLTDHSSNHGEIEKINLNSSEISKMESVNDNKNSIVNNVNDVTSNSITSALIMKENASINTIDDNMNSDTAVNPILSESISSLKEVEGEGESEKEREEGEEKEKEEKEDGWTEAVSRAKSFSLSNHKKNSYSNSNFNKYQKYNRLEKGKVNGMKVYREKTDTKESQKESNSNSNSNERILFRKHRIYPNSVTSSPSNNINDANPSLTTSSSHLSTSSVSLSLSIPTFLPSSSLPSISSPAKDSSLSSTLTMAPSLVSMASSLSSSSSSSPPATVTATSTTAPSSVSMASATSSSSTLPSSSSSATATMTSKPTKFSHNLGFAEILGGTPLGNIKNLNPKGQVVPTGNNLAEQEKSNKVREVKEGKTEPTDLKNQKEMKDGSKVDQTFHLKNRFKHPHHHHQQQHHQQQHNNNNPYPHQPIHRNPHYGASKEVNKGQTSQNPLNDNKNFKLSPQGEEGLVKSNRPFYRENHYYRKSHMNTVNRDGNMNDKKIISNHHDSRYRHRLNSNSNLNLVLVNAQSDLNNASSSSPSSNLSSSLPSQSYSEMKKMTAQVDQEHKGEKKISSSLSYSSSSDSSTPITSSSSSSTSLKMVSIQSGISYKDMAISKLIQNHSNIVNITHSNDENNDNKTSKNVKQQEENNHFTISEDVNKNETKNDGVHASHDHVNGKDGMDVMKEKKDEGDENDKNMECIETVKETLSELKLFSSKEGKNYENGHKTDNFTISNKIDIDSFTNSSPVEISSPSYQDKSITSSLSLRSSAMDSISTVDLNVDENFLMRCESTSPDVKNEILVSASSATFDSASFTKLSASALPYVPSKFGKLDNEKSNEESNHDVQGRKEDKLMEVGEEEKEEKEKNLVGGEGEGVREGGAREREGEDANHYNENSMQFPRNFHPSFYPPFFQSPYSLPPNFLPHAMFHPSMMHPSFPPFPPLNHPPPFHQNYINDDNKNDDSSNNSNYLSEHAVDEKNVINDDSDENKKTVFDNNDSSNNSNDNSNDNNSSDNNDNINCNSNTTNTINENNGINKGDDLLPTINSTPIDVNHEIPHPPSFIPPNQLMMHPFSPSPHLPFPTPIHYPHSFPHPHIFPVAHSPTSPHFHPHQPYPASLLPFPIPPTHLYPPNSFKHAQPPFFHPFPPPSDQFHYNAMNTNGNMESMNPEAAEFVPGKAWSVAMAKSSSSPSLSLSQNLNAKDCEVSPAVAESVETKEGIEFEGREDDVEEKFVNFEMKKGVVKGNEVCDESDKEMNFDEKSEKKNGVYEKEVVENEKMRKEMDRIEIVIGC